MSTLKFGYTISHDHISTGSKRVLVSFLYNLDRLLYKPIMTNQMSYQRSCTSRELLAEGSETLALCPKTFECVERSEVEHHKDEHEDDFID